MQESSRESESEKTLKLIFNELRDRIDQLNSFDSAEEINIYCDDLMAEVCATVQSNVDHLKNLESLLFAQIEDRRREFLDLTSTPMFKDRLATMKQDIEALSKASDELASEWSARFSQVAETEEQIKSAFDQAHDLYLRLSLYSSRMRRAAFGQRVLLFNENQEFLKTQNHIGELFIRKMACENPNELTEMRTMVLDRRHSGDAVLFVSDQVIACSSWDYRLLLYHQKTGKIVHEFIGHTDTIYSLTLLPNGWLASASDDTTIRIWSLCEKKLVRTLEGHTNAVMSLQTLKDGNLASASAEGTIRIWNPYATTNNLLHEFRTNGHAGGNVDLGILSCGFLVSCSADVHSGGIIRIWNLLTAQLIKSFSTQSKRTRNLAILSNDTLAVGVMDGSIKIYDLIDKARSFTINKAHSDYVSSLLELPNGLLLSVSYLNRPTLKLWNPVTGVLIQTISTTHRGSIHSLAISRDGRYLASGSWDKSVEIRRLEF